MEDLTDEEFRQLADALDEPYREYWAGLGRLIHMFSGVEATLQLVAHRLIGISDEIGRAALHGTRIDNTKDVIRRVLQARGDIETLAQLEDTFAQLAHISAARNDLVHWGARTTSEGLTVSNERVAFDPAKRWQYVVSAETLEEMREDLNRIHLSLLYFAMPEGFTTGLDDGSRIRQSFQQVLRATSVVPWRYKPPQRSPKQMRRREPSTRQERRRPRGASEGS